MTTRLVAGAAALQARAKLVSRVRTFFDRRGVTEVSTPLLSAGATPDPALQSLCVNSHSLGRRHFLRTSPEYEMKRLLAAGSGDIWQLGPVFRDDELGRWHQPEFTLLEWYRLGYDDTQLRGETDELLQMLLGDAVTLGESLEIAYDRALAEATGLHADAAEAALVGALQAHRIDVPAALERDGLLDLVMATLVAPQLPADRLTFIVDYPASQSALARLKPGDPPVAARFEAFLGGIELANGFHELTDAREQRARFEAENAARCARGLNRVPIDERFLEALESGLPDCAGVAVGFDRVAALALAADSPAPASIAAGMTFVHEGSAGSERHS